jgi:uncharacterized protein (TIGR02145 family)
MGLICKIFIPIKEFAMNKFMLAMVACSVFTFQTAFAQGVSKTCIDEFASLPDKRKNFDLEKFLSKELPTEIVKVKAQMKLPIGKPKDSKVTDIGITVGCLKAFPEDPVQLQNMVKDLTPALLERGLGAFSSPGGFGGTQSAFSALPAAPIIGTFVDSRDGKSYKHAKIGNQVWMAENLSYNIDDSKCYDNDIANCDKYGRLYHWNAVTKICPQGWHLPTDAEWDALMAALGKASTTGEYLKAKSGWNNHQDKPGGGVDTCGFTALPGGYYGSRTDGFSGIGDYGFWWTATESSVDNANYAYYRSMFNYGGHVRQVISNKKSMFSVRCVQN